MDGASFDTIVAPATPVGRSALAIVRLDGPDAPAIVGRLAGRLPEERKAIRVSLRHDGKIIDDAVVTRWVTPRSFTGNDLAEFTVHGSPAVVDRLLRACIALGARIAEPGEFTERAVLNGRLDLVQAEAIADLVDSRTEVQAQLSLTNLSGRLSEVAMQLHARLLHVASQLEAALDFSDDGYEFIGRDEAIAELMAARTEVAELLGTFQRGAATRRGLSAVILGKPNAGKSTLLNSLVGSERAIVTAIPGTTRDIVRETIEVGGLPVTFADTAGLRATDDLVEGIGVERARDAARRADLILYLVDSTVGLDKADASELAGLGAEVFVVYTKVDLAAPPPDVRAISQTTGQGFSELVAELDACVRERFAVPESSAAVVNQRQQAALVAADSALEAAIATLRAGLSEEMVAVDLYRATNALAALTGAIASDDVLAEIFSKFCIGK